jgi:P4 family phage/plasmid primase-like protien
VPVPEDSELLKLTTARWYNSAQGAKILAHAGSYEQYVYGEDQDYTTAYPAKDRPVHPLYGKLQTAVICSPASGLIVIDVDYPALFADSETGKLLTPAQSWSFRGDHYHIAVDARAFRENWVTQGPTDWGDVKSNGFVPRPGSQHYSGELYVDLSGGQPETRVIEATPELILALKKDLASHERTHPTVTGSNGHDSALASLCFDLYLRGKTEEEIREAWDAAAEPNDPSWPFEDADFARHMRNVPGKAAPILAEWKADYEYYHANFEITDGEVPLSPYAERHEGDEELVHVDELKPSYSGTYFERMCGLRKPGDFDPSLSLDHGYLAEQVLRKIRPVIAYDRDSGGWVEREEDGVWNIASKDATFSRGIILELAKFMLPGDKEADPMEIGIAEANAQKNRFTNRGLFDKRAGTLVPDLEAKASRGLREIAVRVSELDSLPYVLWAGGVPWDLTSSQTKLVRAHIAPETPHLKAAGYYPDLSVDTPLWDNFIETVMPDPSLRFWALRVLSVCVTGSSAAVMPMLVGSSGRGKTALMSLLMNLLGSYAVSANASVIDPKSSDSDYHTFELMGSRLAFIDEAPQPGPQAQRKLKQITGGGVLTGRPIYGKPVQFVSTHTLVLTGNRGPDDPQVSDEAIQRRIRLIPFEANAEAVKQAMLPIGQASEGFKEAWRAEAPGVLAKMILEAAAYINDTETASNDNAPIESLSLKADIIRDQDTVLTWYEDMTEPYEAGTKSTDLRENYVAWAKNNGERVDTSQKFSKRLCELCGIEKPLRNSKCNYYPIRIKQGGEGWPGIPQSPVGGVAQPLAMRNTSVTPVANTVKPEDRGTPPSKPEDFKPGPAVSSMFQGLTVPANQLPAVRSSAPASEPSQSPSRSEPDDTKARLREIIDKAPAPDWAIKYDPVENTVGFTGEPPSFGFYPGPTNQDFNDSAAAAMAHAYDEFYGGQPAPAPDWAIKYEDAGSGPVTLTDVEAGLITQEQKDLSADQGLDAEVGTPEPQPIEHTKPARKPAQTAEEKAAAAAEKKRLAAEAKEAKRQERIAEVGGRIITLPAIVNRNLEIREVSVAEAEEFLSFCLDEMSVDVETSGFGIGHKNYKLRLVQLGNEFAAVVLDPHDQEQAEVIRWAVAGAQELHAHNANADLLPLEHAGLCDASVWNRMTDTLLLAKLVDPALSDSDEAALKPLSKALLGDDYALSWKCEKEKAKVNAAGGWLTQTTPVTPLEKSGWAMIPICEVFVKYAASDVLDCSATARVLAENLLRIYGSPS